MAMPVSYGSNNTEMHCCIQVSYAAEAKAVVYAVFSASGPSWSKQLLDYLTADM